jgi:alpha-glucosidase
MVFNFLPLQAAWTKAAWQDMIERVERELPSGAWPTWVLSNHDISRVRTRLGSEEAARAAAVVLTTQRGTPFIYQGDELGLKDAIVPEKRRVDPGGRDGCRAPLPWEPGHHHGWPAAPWLPWPPDSDSRNATSEWANQQSMLHLYRDLLAARRASPALRRGTVRLHEAPEDVLAYERVSSEDRRLVLVNFGERPVDVPLPEPWHVEVASATQPDAGALPPHSAALLRPPA